MTFSEAGAVVLAIGWAVIWSMHFGPGSDILWWLRRFWESLGF